MEFGSIPAELSTGPPPDTASDWYRAAVRRLHPNAGTEVDPAEAYAADRPGSAERPWLMVNMVASADGSSQIDGRSGGLGGPADKAVFAELRGLADVVLVAAGTARDENYGAIRVTGERRERRLARGQDPVPRLAMVTRTLALDPDAPVFADAETAPYVITTADAPADRKRALAAVSEPIVAGAERVDLPTALSELGQRGARVVLAEGGPSLNGQLITADLVDELCLTVSPLLVGGDGLRVSRGGPGQALPLRLAHVLEADGLLFLRYLRDRG